MTEIKRIFSLDAGRKYFSLHQLKAIVDKLAQTGYTDFHLLVGHDGLRFVLDDMSVVVSGHVYPNQAVQEAIKNGNESYHADDNPHALTETEMTELISYTRSKGLGFIPAIDSPGHMNTLLTAMEHLGIASPRHADGERISKRTMDLSNSLAVGFTKALLKKYLAYFADKVSYFNLGADEYANDIYVEGAAEGETTNGFAVLQGQGKYSDFVSYVNDLAALVKSFGLIPIAFNDGIYYNEDTQTTFDKDIIISYWTGGWEGYDAASPTFLHEKGHKLLNTNDAWYHVIGRLEEEDGYYHKKQCLAGINQVPINQLPKLEADQVSLIGAMMATWCDQPEKDFDEEVTFELLTSFAQKHFN